MKTSRHPFGSLILPDKEPQLRQLIADLKGPRKQEFEELHRRFGISHLEIWLIQTMQGPLVMGTFEAENEHALAEMSSSGEPLLFGSTIKLARSMAHMFRTSPGLL